MKTQKSLLKVLSVCLIIIFLSGCAATVNFTYNVQKPPVVENKVNSNATIYFSIVDLRAEPDIIGYMKNIYGMRMKKIKPSELDISKSIYVKYKEEFLKKGFIFSDNASNSDMKLTLSITTFLGEMSTGMVTMTTNADCCMKVSLVSNKDNKELFSTTVCGKGEKKTGMAAGKKDIPEALSYAVDDVLSKMLSETELINSINKFNK
jgi:uncharacterized lipoprotein YajG